jgi:hypothetical protein
MICLGYLLLKSKFIQDETVDGIKNVVDIMSLLSGVASFSSL